MKPARRARSGRQSVKSRPSESAAVNSIPSSVAGRSGTPAGPLKAYVTSAPNAMKSPYAKLTSRRIPYTIDTPTAAIAITDPVTRPFASSWRNTPLDQLGFGHGTILREPADVEDVERRVAAALEDRVREDPRHGRRDHEPVAAEAGGDIYAFTHLPEQWLVVGRHVVLAAHEQREGNVRQPGNELVDRGPHTRAPHLPMCVVAARAEVAGEHPPVRELLGCEAPLG